MNVAFMWGRALCELYMNVAFMSGRCTSSI